MRSEYGLWISIIAMYYMCNANGRSDSDRVPRKCVIVYAQSVYSATRADTQLRRLIQFCRDILRYALRRDTIKCQILKNDSSQLNIDRRFIFLLRIEDLVLRESKLLYSMISKLFIFIEKYLCMVQFSAKHTFNDKKQSIFYIFAIMYEVNR